MARKYITDPKQLITLAIAGVQTVFECDAYSQPDQIFEYYRGNEREMLRCFQSDLGNGHRFYIDTE